MESNTEKLYVILEIADEIRELLFGHGFEDFRNNRKLKIQIIDKLLNIIDAIDDAGDLLADFIPVAKFDEIKSIKSKLISEANGISEEFVWQLCKRDLLLLTKAIGVINRR